MIIYKFLQFSINNKTTSYNYQTSPALDAENNGNRELPFNRR